METIGMETIGAIIAATVPLIILVWVWVVGRELDRQSNRLRELQITLEDCGHGWLPMKSSAGRKLILLSYRIADFGGGRGRPGEFDTPLL
jgi:hypothetical protein